MRTSVRRPSARASTRPPTRRSRSDDRAAAGRRYLDGPRLRAGHLGGGSRLPGPRAPGLRLVRRYRLLRRHGRGLSAARPRGPVLLDTGTSDSANRAIARSAVSTRPPAQSIFIGSPFAPPEESRMPVPPSGTVPIGGRRPSRFASGMRVLVAGALAAAGLSACVPTTTAGSDVFLRPTNGVFTLSGH